MSQRELRPNAATSPPGDLTTGRAPYVEEMRQQGQIFIRQPYDLYSVENQEAWRQLCARMEEPWQQYAADRFLDGLGRLALDRNRVPRLEEVNHRMAALSGFRTTAVSGYMPVFLFFDCLRRREFPTSITIRPRDNLDYSPEPDMFHDLAGHAPMNTDAAYADLLVRLGQCTHTAVERVRDIEDEAEKLRRLTSTLKGIGRFVWFTVEFGLVRSFGGLKVYGSGLLSSAGEIRHAVEAPDVQRHPAQLPWLINQYFEIDHYQPLLFIIDSFDHLFDLAAELETWLNQGKLENVAPGEPSVSQQDLADYLGSNGTVTSRALTA